MLVVVVFVGLYIVYSCFRRVYAVVLGKFLFFCSSGFMVWIDRV